MSKSPKTKTTADDLAKTGKDASVELTESELDQASGGHVHLEIHGIKGETTDSSPSRTRS